MTPSAIFSSNGTASTSARGGEQKSRKFFSGLCAKLGGILYNRSLFSSFIEKN